MERLWKNVNYNKKTSRIVAIRSDGLIVLIDLHSPVLGENKKIAESFERLEEFRTCKCSVTSQCEIHQEE